MQHASSRLAQFFFQLALSVLTFFSVATYAESASAAGRVVWKNTTITEKDGKGFWRLDLELHLARAPDVAWYAVKFEFEPIAYYERALLDGKEGPQERVVPLTGQQSLIETQDVGFMDPGTGKIQQRTRFTFKVTRAHGYEAGEYKVTIRDAQSGSLIGTPTTLKFKGENEIIDRRAIVFQANEKKKKSESAPAPTERSEADEESAPVHEERDTTAGSTPPAVEERPGGGCHHGPAHPEQWAWGLLGATVLLLSWARRQA